MGNKISTAIGESDGATQVSVQSKNKRERRRVNIQMVQNVLLIWLDKRIDDNDPDCCNTVTQLRRIVHNINKYTDGDKCIKFLDTVQNENVCMVISGSLGIKILPRVHDMSQIDSIFIFCNTKEYHEQWAKEWPKIKGVFTEITSICEALKKAAQQCEQDAMPISFIDNSSDISKKSLDQLEPSFLYTQIVKEILLTINFEQQHINEFIAYWRDALAEDEDELKNIKTFERNYHDNTPIWWYTYPCFLYPMLNRALRLMNADMITNMGFFIADLHRHIEQLHKQQFGNPESSTSFIVYRRQNMSKANFDRMLKTKDGLIAFNNFLLTSKNHQVSLDFAHDTMTKPEMIGILFVMTIDPAKSTATFASIAGVSYFKDKKDEILFSMHTVFRISKITPMDGNTRLFRVELTLTSKDDKDLRLLTDRIHEETDPNSKGWHRLGEVLLKMAECEKAQQVYELLLEQTTDEGEKGYIYDRLGAVHDDKGDYQEAIKFYEKSLEINKKLLSPNHSDLVPSYNNIGLVYRKVDNYPKALSSHEKALEIQQQSLSPNHPELAASYNNIGLVYRKMDDYPKALSSYKRALEIQQQSLQPNHPELAASYNNIGLMYHKMGDIITALSYYEKDLEISKQSLAPNHPDLAMSYNNIAVMCDIMGEYSKALSSHEKALEIRRSFPPNSPDLGASYNNIGMMYYNMNDYLKALSSHEKALQIRQSLPSNHPDLGSSYDNIGMVYDKLGDYSKARSFYERAVNIGQLSLPSNHPRLQQWKHNLENVKA